MPWTRSGLHTPENDQNNQPNKISAFSKEKQNQQVVPLCRAGHIYRMSRHTGVPDTDVS
jgi:hypothetical protein